MDKGRTIAFVMPWHISERGGGAEVQANYLAQELAARGHHVSYICQTTNAKKINTVETIGEINVHFLKPSGRFQWQDQNKYLEPLRTIQPNYILQRLSSNVIYVLGKYCDKNNCKLVWFCTDNNSPYTDLYFSKFKERSTVKSLGVVKYCLFAISNTLMDYYRNKGMKYVDVAFSQNDFQKENVKSNFGLESFRMISGHPIPDQGISISQRFNNKTILWCANFGTHKRPELFIELASKMQHTDLKFVMVGGHSNKKYVEQLLDNKPTNLTTTGKLNFDDALNHFNEATIFINTSTPGGDGFPNTFIQAWLRHVPVISLGFDPDDVITNNSLGYILSEIYDIIQHIESLLNNQSEYEKLSTNAYNFAVGNHSIKKMTDNFLKQLEDEGSALS